MTDQGYSGYPGSGYPGRDGVPGPRRLVLDAGRFWAGAAATAVVAALAAVVGVLVFDGIFDIDLLAPNVFGLADADLGRYVIAAVAATIVAALLMHVLVLSTPRPRAFFGWIIALLTLAAALAPFALDAEMESEIATAVVNAVIGIVIGTLIASVAGRTVRTAPAGRRPPV